MAETCLFQKMVHLAIEQASNINYLAWGKEGWKSHDRHSIKHFRGVNRKSFSCWIMLNKLSLFTTCSFRAWSVETCKNVQKMKILKWAETFVQNCIELYYTLCLPSELANIKDYLKIVFSWHLDLSVAFPALCLLGKVLIMDTSRHSTRSWVNLAGGNDSPQPLY
jgi:hypothetical protein